MKCVCGHCHCPICGNQMTEAKVIRLNALREVREMVREYKEHNPDTPQSLSFAEDYVADGILQRIDAMIAALGKERGKQ